MADAAAIRFNNPGAMWDGKIATRWGSKHSVILADGQSNHIAIFPTMVQGAAAQFDLWRSNYVNMSLKDAVKKWSGGNSSANYMQFLKSAGFPGNTLITPAFLASPQGIGLMKAQAHWESAKVYPMTDADWAKAQSMVFKTPLVSTGLVTGSFAVAAVTATAAAHPATETWLHSHWPSLLVGIIVAAVVIDLAVYFIRKRNV